VTFAVRKQAGGNTVAITDRLRAVLAKNAAAYPELTIKPIHEDARFIRSNLEDVRLNILFGGLMAVLVVFVFMRDWRSTLITALALPTSVIATFFFMWAAGFTLNMMTLMAISLVIGILIDDAVVVRENIYRHMEEGEDPMTAARKGTAEIGLAVMATTFTILAVFLPVGFMTGLVGQFFKSFALTVAFAVAMSLVIAFTLDPMLSSRFVRYVPPEERVRTRWAGCSSAGATRTTGSTGSTSRCCAGRWRTHQSCRGGAPGVRGRVSPRCRSSAPSSCRMRTAASSS
jgi:HAE1 family hydrophobic/amphiphilic exporter-1